MSDERFLELVNLCIDNEMNDAEAAEFERALDASSERRAIYEQYRLMDQGCRVLVERAQRQAPSSLLFRRTINSLEWKMAHPGQSRWREPMVLAWASAVAAACLMFALTTMNETSRSGDASSIVASAQDSLHRQGAVSFEDVAAIIAERSPTWKSQKLDKGEVKIAAVRPSGKNSLKKEALDKLSLQAWANVHAANGTEAAEEMSAFQFQR